MLAILGNSRPNLGPAYSNIWDRPAFVWRPVVAFTGPQMPTKGIVNGLTLIKGYCMFWGSSRGSQVLEIFGDSGRHLGTGSLSNRVGPACVWRPVECPTKPKMPLISILKRSRPMKGYCIFWDSYRGSQKLATVVDREPHWGTWSLSIWSRPAVVWIPMESPTDPRMTPQSILKCLRSV